MTTTTVVNKYRDKYDIYIGRGSIYGNPFTHIKSPTKAEFKVDSRDEAVESYRKWVIHQDGIMRSLPALRGLTLGCFCHPQACHGDVLIELLEQYTDEELSSWESNPNDD